MFCWWAEHILKYFKRWNTCLNNFIFEIYLNKEQYVLLVACVYVLYIDYVRR